MSANYAIRFPFREMLFHPDMIIHHRLDDEGQGHLVVISDETGEVFGEFRVDFEKSRIDGERKLCCVHFEKGSDKVDRFEGYLSRNGINPDSW